MIWPFKRKESIPPINEDWCVGDEAECITPGEWDDAVGPEIGDVFVVQCVMSGRCSQTGKPLWGLRFKPWEINFDTLYFRKLVQNSVVSDYIVARIRKAPSHRKGANA